MISTVLNNMGPGLVRERFYLTFADLTTAGTSQTITLKSLPKGTVILGAFAKHEVIFAGGAIATCTLSVGLAAGAADTIIDASDMTAVVADTTLYKSGGNEAVAPFIATAAADSLTATIVTTVGNVNAATAGKVWIDVFYILALDLTGVGPVGNQVTASGGF